MGKTPSQFSALKMVLGATISSCAFASLYVESTDYEYTNTINDIDKSALEDMEKNQDKDEELAISDFIHIDKIDTSITIDNAGSDDSILDEINQAEQAGNVNDLQIDFSNASIVECYNYMKSVNEQTQGWLNIPNQGSYPVMYSGDNSFYLNHSCYGYYHENGAIFLNANCKNKFNDISLIHGHHLKTGGMFGSLKKYKDTKYFQTNNLVEVYDGTVLRYYRPFTVFFYEDGVEGIRLSFSDQADKDNYCQKLYEKSMVQMADGYQPRFDTDIMFLSTCDYEFENCRLAVGFYCVTTVKN